jgi:hypothetical protein
MLTLTSSCCAPVDARGVADNVGCASHLRAPRVFLGNWGGGRHPRSVTVLLSVDGNLINRGSEEDNVMASTKFWEFMRCGKEVGCPAYPDHGFQCWNVAGTLCRSERQGNYEQKVGACRQKCEYYSGGHVRQPQMSRDRFWIVADGRFE